MAAANHRYTAENIFNNVTSHSNPFMTLTAVNESQGQIKMDYINERNERYAHYNPFYCEEEPVELRQRVTEVPHEPIQPRLSSTNPFLGANMDSYCFQDNMADIQSSQPCFHVHNHQTPALLHNLAMPPAATVPTPKANPFSSAHLGSFIQSTPANYYLPCSTCPRPHATS